MTDRPPPPPRTKSGEHPAVSVYRDKLDSIVDNQAEEIDALNRSLEAYIKESSSPPSLGPVCPECGCASDFFNMECTSCVQRSMDEARRVIPS